MDLRYTQGSSCLALLLTSLTLACSLLCPYLLEEVCTRVETEDEEVRALGSTCRTPRRLFAPSNPSVEETPLVLAPYGLGGVGRPILSPLCLCLHFRTF